MVKKKLVGIVGPDGTVYVEEESCFSKNKKEIGYINEKGIVRVTSGKGYCSTEKEIGRVDFEGNVWLGEKNRICRTPTYFSFRCCTIAVNCIVHKEVEFTI